MAKELTEFDPDSRIRSSQLFDRIRSNDDGNSEVVDLYDRDNPNAMVNMLSEKLRAAVLAIPVEYHLMRESKLHAQAEISDIDSLARVAFWNEYLLAKDNRRKIFVENIYKEVCSREYFYRYMVSDPKKLAYIVRPMKSYQLRLEELLDIAQEQMREIMLLPILDSKGKPDVKLIAEKIKILQITENRVKGSVVNRVKLESRNVSVVKNMNDSGKELTADEELEQLEAQIKLLRQEHREPISVMSEVIATDGVHERRIEERVSRETADGTASGETEE